MTELVDPAADEPTAGESPVRAIVVSPPPATVVPLGHTAVIPSSTDAPLSDTVTSLRQIIDNRMFVVGMLLVVGPLGLPLVWLNRRFSLWSKIGWTVVFVSFTVVLPVALVWYWCNTAMQPLLDAFGK